MESSSPITPVPTQHSSPQPPDGQLSEVEAEALIQRMERENPGWEIWTGTRHTQRMWFGRGPDARPWLVMSDDLLHFRRMLRA